MTYELYLVTNKHNGKRYVGQTQSNIGFESRWKDHWQEALRSTGHQCVFHSAIKGYGVEAFEAHRILKDIPESEIDKLEKIWIQRLNTFYIDGNGYNMTLGGQGVHGFKHSEETRRRISETLKQVPNYWTPELIARTEKKKRDSGYYERRSASNWRQNLSIAAKKRFAKEPGTFTGRTHTEETRRKISQLRSNQKASDATKLKMVLTRGTPVAMLDANTRETLETFGALSLARDYLIAQGVACGKYATDTLRTACKSDKICYGYRWSFLSSVTTNPDECKDVGDEMSASSKCATRVELFND